jgi:hypothetical protein
LRLCGTQKKSDPGNVSDDVKFMGYADFIIELYGIRTLITDIDRDREFWRDSDSIVSAVLNWAINEGFHDYFAQFDIEQRSAHEYRQRHILDSLKRGF